MLGYDEASELLGRDMRNTVRQRQTSATAGEQSSLAHEYGEFDCIEDSFLRRDGSSFPVEYWSHPMLHDGKLIGTVATFFNITERVHMQAALRQGEVRIAALVDAVNDAVITIDADRRILLFNRAAERLFAVSSAEALGCDVAEFVSLGSSDPDGEGVPTALDHGAVQELIGKRSDGRSFPLEVSISELATEQGLLVTAVLRDVTDLQLARVERQAREALEASSRAKSVFLSRVSHELRTPLNAVLGFSQLLRLDSVERLTDAQLERIEHIEIAGRHLLALVNDVLDLSRVESGQLAVTLESVDLFSAVKEALSMVLPSATAAGVHASISGLENTMDSSGEPGHQKVCVLADRTRLRQVLTNLLSNSVKYNRPGGEVKIGWKINAGQCELRVMDNGLGIASDKLGRLFEPFNRLGAEHSKVEGTGIGLVLSRRLVEAMSGELHVISALGEGTTASLTLPCSAVPAPAKKPFSPSQHGLLDDSVHVLYAEDNEVNVAIVRQLVLLRPSVELDVAECGALALRKARHSRPQLMLVDMNLGDMSGLELAQAIRSDPLTADIRLVAVSADAMPEHISAALDVGFEGYLTKPLDFRKLLEVLDSVQA